MKLWEAMLRGSKLSKQSVGQISDGNGGRCAIGSALDGAGVCMNDLMDERDTYNKLTKLFPISLIRMKCPACQYPLFEKNTVLTVIWHLNDQHKWCREAIAEWIRVEVENDIKPIVLEPKNESISDCQRHAVS